MVLEFPVSLSCERGSVVTVDFSIVVVVVTLTIGEVVTGATEVERVVSL